MRSVFLTVLVLLALTEVAADPVVTRIDFRFISKDAAPGSFQASTRKMWRAGGEESEMTCLTSGNLPEGKEARIRVAITRCARDQPVR
jgi:hypothetical protein